LFGAIQHQSPAELGRFRRRIAEAQQGNGKQEGDEAVLLQAARARLPKDEERRLKRLIAKSERDTLSARELADYQVLAQRAQRLDVERVEALAELVRRRGKPLAVVLKEIGWEGGRDGA
jgi:hypothetical protein